MNGVQSIDEIRIHGFVSLSLNVLTVPETTSNRKRKNLDGYSAKRNGHVLGVFPCYLIGQLSKNSNLGDTDLTGKELLEWACTLIEKAATIVGGRYLMVECKSEEKLINFYKVNDFHEFAHIGDDDTEMVQMIRKLN